LRLRDDGCGFDRNAPAPAASKNGGMGLMDIEERVRLVGGTCVVKSVPAAGTEVAIELPLQTRSAATLRHVPEPLSPLT
jgi:two-component system sensor histidine kinase DegS